MLGLMQHVLYIFQSFFNSLDSCQQCIESQSLKPELFLVRTLGLFSITLFHLSIAGNSIVRMQLRVISFLRIGILFVALKVAFICFRLSVYVEDSNSGMKRDHRLISHTSDIKLGKNSCAVTSNALFTGHKPDFDNVKIFHTEKNWMKRTFLELTYINSEPNAMNKRSFNQNLNIIYCQLLDQINFQTFQFLYSLT